jgi:hypothetical protein
VGGPECEICVRTGSHSVPPGKGEATIGATYTCLRVDLAQMSRRNT